MKRALVPVLATALALSACTDLRDIKPPGQEVSSKAQRLTQAAPDSDVAAATTANTALGLKLLGQNPDQNFILSSYSITSAASLLEAGAKGETLDGIEKALQQTLAPAQHHRVMNTVDAALETRGATAKGKDGKPFRLVVTNQLFAQKGQHLEPAYLDTLAQEYGAGLRLLDFSTDAARQSINQWVSQRTEGKITDLFAPDSLRGASLVVVNTLYFNAAWGEAFEAAKTTSEPFTLVGGSTVSAPSMHNDRLETAKAAVVDGVQVLELPYDGDDVSLVVLAPPAADFKSFEKGLDASKVKRLTDALTQEPLDVRLPKFKFNSQLDLMPGLKELGMTAAFDASKADFSGMTGDRSLFIGVAVHQAVIILDESGTEAAAATGFGGFKASAPAPAHQVVIDRPFVFFIKDVKTGLALFTGRVVDPR